MLVTAGLHGVEENPKRVDCLRGLIGPGAYSIVRTFSHPGDRPPPINCNDRIRDGERFDVVVVGAGLAGCSTALHLALERPELRIALLEAETVAAGASGRGTGLLGPRLGPPIDIATKRDGDRASRARYLGSERAVRRVLELAARFRPGAVSPTAGQLVVGFTAAEQVVVRRRAAAYARLGLPVSLVPAGPPTPGPASSLGTSSPSRSAPP